MVPLRLVSSITIMLITMATKITASRAGSFKEFLIAVFYSKITHWHIMQKNAQYRKNHL
jgi:hypothetical protein